MAENETHQEFNLRDYWQILVRRRWLIYTCVLVVTVAAAVSSFLATPVYRSTCTIAIERTGVRILRQNLTSAEPSWLDYQNFYNTQYQIIQSDAVLRRAIDRMDLMHRDDLPGMEEEEEGLAAQVGKKLGSLKRSLVRFVSRTQVPEGEEDPYYPYLKLLRSGLSVEPVRDSHLVQISFVSPDREFAAEAANAVARAYIDFTLSYKLEIAEQSKDFFIERIHSLQEEIANLEEDLREYARTHHIVTGDSTDVALQNLADLRSRYTEAEANLAKAKARYESLLKTPAESLDEVRHNPLIQGLAREVSDAESRYRELLATYGPAFPEVKKQEEKLRAAKDRLKEETRNIARKVIEGAKADYLQAKKEVTELGRLYDKAKQQVDRFQSDYVQYQQLKLMVDRKRATLNDLLDRENQMVLSASLVNAGDSANNVRIIDEAKPARQIYKPKKKLNILLGFLFGLFLGVGAAVLMEYIDNTLKTPDDVRQVLGFSVLGMVPSLSSTTRTKGRTRREDLAAEPALISAEAPLSPIAEAYRELRTAVLLATPGHPPRDLCVTSCQPGEGKTTTTINLATTLAQLGRRVLVVDADLRKPRCHQVLKVASSQGMSTWLTGMSGLDDLILPTRIENLSVIPAGPIPPNPAELLDSSRFSELVEHLRNDDRFDHVLFDTPPVLSVVDPLLVGRHVEGTVLVIKSGFTTREAGKLGKEKLETGRVNVLGVVLNAVEIEHVPYQYRYYRYGYGQKGDAGQQKGKRVAAAGSHDA